MKTLSNRLKESGSLLTPYAVPLHGTLGRVEPEPEDETRFPFQRDRDRIIHTQAFRRLQGKTQVLVPGEGDHFRTRLTHTMEVAQLSRDIARTLSLNEDLAECIALAHDLGHPPFGHRGEAALDTWMRSHGFSFEHNEQSLRLVALLEIHSSNSEGLNLHREILEGLQKHVSFDARERGPSLEAQIVNIADEIAYTSHDCDDGLRANFFSEDELCQVPLALEARTLSALRRTSIRGCLIHLLVSDLYASTENLLGSRNIKNLMDVYEAKSPLVLFSEEMQGRLADLRKFLTERMYDHAKVVSEGKRGQEIILTLCNAFETNPPDKVLSLQRKTGGALPEAIKDYVSGMTDAFAEEQVDTLPKPR